MKLKNILILLIGLVLAPGLFAQITFGDDLSEFDYAHPKEYEIGGITISGVQYLDHNVLIMLSGLAVGDRVSVPGDELTEAIKNLWGQELFENVTISATKVVGEKIFLDIELKERPKLSRFSFTGVKKAEVDKIREEITISRGDVVTENLLITAENKIKDHFRSKGYLNTEVFIKEQADTTDANGVALRFEIKKNSRIRIYQINVHGNSALTDLQVKRAFKETKEKGAFRPFNTMDSLFISAIHGIMHFDFYSIVKDAKSYVANDFKFRIFKSSKYIEDNYLEDKKLLVERYNRDGYRDARIANDSIYRSGDNTINIDIWVDEGPQYHFRDINWVGNTKYSSEVLSNILKISKGDIYNKKVLDANLSFNPNGQDVSSLYLDDGYLFFNVDPVEVRVENDSIDLEMRIYEGKQATINKVTVSGNTRTNDHVVMREIRTRPGQLFNRSDIIRTTRELAQLRYFDAEKINPIPKPNPVDGTVDIEYQVEETSSDQIELSGGWGYGRIIGTLGLSFNNFSARRLFKKEAWKPIPSGDGQKLSLRLQSYGTGYISYNASFTEPWLGGKKPNALTVSYYHSLYSNEKKKGDPDRQAFVIDGVTVGLGKRLTWPDDFFTLYQAINLQRYELEKYTSIFAFGDGNGNYNNISYNLNLSRNSIDAPIYPRSGSEVGLSVELTPPYSWFSEKDYENLSENERYKWIEFHKWKFNASFYKQVYGDLVVSFRTKYGFLGSYNSDIGVTPFERFYLGGDGLSGYNNLDGREIVGMRGYGNETLTPNYYAERNVGGTIYNKNTLEIRYPLSLNPSATIYGLAFLEAGNAWKDFDNFNPFGLYRTAGVGMRVFLPMFGVLGLDWGYGFDDVPGLPSAGGGQFHFSINQSID